jgi:hypothetical protein
METGGKEAEVTMYQEATLLQGYGQMRSMVDPSGELALAARKWRDARLLGQLGRAWSLLTGRSRRLLDLSTLRASSSLQGGHSLGIRTVAISKIRGSESRSEDYDTDWHPLQQHNEDRWLSVAGAYLRGVALPPVELIQVGDVYYVRDGHHRISVARACGQVEIEAEVTVWEMASLPRSARPVAAHKPTRQAA